MSAPQLSMVPVVIGFWVELYLKPNKASTLLWISISIIIKGLGYNSYITD